MCHFGDWRKQYWKAGSRKVLIKFIIALPDGLHAAIVDAMWHGVQYEWMGCSRWLHLSRQHGLCGRGRTINHLHETALSANPQNRRLNYQLKHLSGERGNYLTTVYNFNQREHIDEKKVNTLLTRHSRHSAEARPGFCMSSTSQIYYML